jgi:hypothetical protein
VVVGVVCTKELQNVETRGFEVDVTLQVQGFSGASEMWGRSQPLIPGLVQCWSS